MKKYISFIIITTVIVFIGSFLIINQLNENNVSSIPNLFPRSWDSNVSAEYLNAQRNVDYYRKKIENNNRDPKNYIELTQVYLQEARVTGLHHKYMMYAENLMNTALDIDPGNFEAMITKASILMIYHRFNEAKQLVLKSTQKNPYNSAAYGVLCDAYVETGEYEKAVSTCDKMLSIHPDINSYSRASYLREIYGDMNSAIDAMRLAADAGLTGSDSRAWALYNLGNLYLKVGKLDTAAFIYNGILEERPGYANAYNGLAKIMVVNGNFKKAIEYLFTASQISPDHAFIEELAEIYHLSGNKDSENVMIAEVLKEFEEHETDGWNIKREFAKFCAIHNINLEEALEGIESEYETSPSSIEVIHLYAWLLFKNYQTEKGMSIIQKAMKFGTHNPVLKYHAGIIFEAGGRYKDALNHFQTSLAENLFIHPLYFEDARSRIASLQMLVSTQ